MADRSREAEALGLGTLCRMRVLGLGALLALVALTAASSIQAAPARASEPIGDAVYKGKARGDGRKVVLNTTIDRGISQLEVRFDARCRQGGKHYTNKNTGWVFSRIKVRRSGKFKSKVRKSYPGGWHKAIVKGRFRKRGKVVRGKFSFDSRLSASDVECSARARFKARTKAKPDAGGGPAGPPKGQWVGTTGQGLDIEFYVARPEGEGAIQTIRFEAQVECVRDEGAVGSPTYTMTYRGRLDGSIEGANFEAAEESDRVAGRFEGRTASGVISVTNYRDELELANCSTPGEIPFTARHQARHQ